MPMQRREFLRTVGAGVFLAAMGDGTKMQGAGREQPNIVLCMADDQGWGDMGYYGHPVLKTPNFDAMAAAALRFDRFYAAAPVCSPTRGSVLTGRHPNRFGCFSWGHTLRPQEITLAEALKTAGYATGHFGKWHVGTVYAGSPVNPGASGFDEWLSAPNFYDNNPILSHEGTAVRMRGESSMVAVDAALEFIRKHTKARQPFLAVVWFGSPHGPHRAVDADRAPYAALDDVRRRHFYGEITGMDRAFGKLRAELRTLGIRDNTILWYCSDNGGLPKLGVTGGRGNKGQIYEGGLRVPAILEWPARIRKSRITNVACNTSDIYPTLLEMTGVRMKNQPPLDGVSLASLMDGKMTARPKPMMFWQYPAGGIGTPSGKLMAELLKAQRAGKPLPEGADVNLDAGKIGRKHPDNVFPGHAAILVGPWKLHQLGRRRGTARLELYHLGEDPGETRNVVALHAKRVTSMKSELEKWQASVVRSLNGADYR